MAGVIAITFVLTCFGLGIFMGYLDELKWRSWDDYFEIWMKKYMKRRKNEKPRAY